MKLHATRVAQADVHQAVANALKNPKTVVFADTSILFWLFRLGRGPLAEVRAWIEDDLAGRFFIPVWCAHELQGYLQGDQGALVKLPAEIKATEARLRETSGFVRAAVDAVAWRDHYPDKSAYLAALEEAERNYLRLCNLAAGHVNFDERAEDLIPFINSRLLASNIFPMLRWIDADYAARVEGRIPPGWMDERGKDDNRWGDLMIWNEIVSYCHAKGDVSNVVFLTNDNKRDWVFRPRVKVGPRAANNTGPHETLLTAPLLAHELSISGDATEFYLANDAALAVVLHRYVGRSTPELFAAVQPLAMPSDAQSADRTHARRAPLPPRRDADARESPEPEVVRLPALGELLDGGASLSSPAAELIAALTGADLSAQEDAVGRLDGEALRDAPDAVLFATGRALGAAARSGAAAATHRLHAYRLSPQNTARADIALYAGALYDLYFGPDGQLRDLPLDGAFEAVLAASAQPEFTNAVELVNGALAGKDHRFLALPAPGGPPPRLELQLVTDPKALGGRDELNQIRVGERELIENLEEGDADLLSAAFGGATKGNVQELTTAVSRRYGVPRGWLTTNSTPGAKLAWLPTRGFRRL